MENKITAAELAKTIIANTYHSHAGNEGYDQRPYIVGDGYINGLTGYTCFADGRHDQEWDASPEDVLRQVQEMLVGQCLVLPEYSGCHYNGASVYLKTNRKGDFMLLDGVEGANLSRLFGDKFLENVSSFEIVQIFVRDSMGENDYFRTTCGPDGFVGMVDGMRKSCEIYKIEIVDYARYPRGILNH